MTNYYKNKMEDSYKKWEVAIENSKPVEADKHMNDHLNYKSMYDSKMKEIGETV